MLAKQATRQCLVRNVIDLALCAVPYNCRWSLFPNTGCCSALPALLQSQCKTALPHVLPVIHLAEPQLTIHIGRYVPRNGSTCSRI